MAKKPPAIPKAEEDLCKIVVGELKPHDVPIILAEYDPEWPRLCEREETRIRKALGSGALLIEHVGSTSVPGLAAKIIIDILSS